MTYPLTSILQQFDVPTEQVQLRPWAGQGFSGSQIWKISLPATHRHYCLRAFPPGKPDLETLRWRTEQLQRAAPFDFLCLPLFTRDGQTHLSCDGRLWQIEPWADGKNDFHQQASNEKLASVMLGLARLHEHWKVPGVPQSTTSLGLARRISLLNHWLGQGDVPWMACRAAIGQRSDFTASDGVGQWELHRDATDQRTAWWSLLERIQQQFTKHAGPLLQGLQATASLKSQICVVLGDPWSDHLFFKDHQLTAIIDYDAMRLDTPVADLSRCLCSLVGQDADRQRQALAHYQKVSPLRDQQWELLYWYNLSSRVLGPLLWLQWLFLDQTIRPQTHIQQRLEKTISGAPF